MSSNRRNAKTKHVAPSSRSVPYDLQLPENKTELKADLTNRGITFPVSAKKSSLIKLWKQNLDATTVTDTDIQTSLLEEMPVRGCEPQEVPTSQESEIHNALLQNKNRHDTRAPSDVNQLNGDFHGLICELASTMKTLADKVSKLEDNDITSRLTNANAQAISPEVNHSHMTRVPISVNNHRSIPGTGNFDQVEVPQPVCPQAHSLVMPQPLSTAPAYSIDQVNAPPSSNIPTDSFSLATAMNRSINTQDNRNYVKTPHGYSAESLPLVETISPNMRKNIIEGKDVNLAALLIPNYSGPMNNDDRLSVNSCHNRKPDPRLNRNLSLNEFMKAFGIYKNVMCQAYPSRREELDMYERDIVDMGYEYGGKGFYEYHKIFSSQAAYLRYHNIKVDWSVRNNRLFCNVFVNHKPNSCNLCQSTTHSAGFCPQLLQNKFNDVYREA